jgi:hypothetical protein
MVLKQLEIFDTFVFSLRLLTDTSYGRSCQCGLFGICGKTIGKG